MSLNPYRDRPVNTEFLFSEADPTNDEPVFLCGDWNAWSPIPMFLHPTITTQRPPHTPVWSVVTRVSAGYHEFCYVVDGEHRVSSGHPQTADEACNWRYVKGPPRKSRATRLGPMAELGPLGYIGELLCGDVEAGDKEETEVRLLKWRRSQFLSVVFFVLVSMVIGIVVVVVWIQQGTDLVGVGTRPAYDKADTPL